MARSESMFGAAIADLGALSLFLSQAIRALVAGRVRFRHVWDQMYVVGVRSLPTTLMAGSFVGAIMAIQINLQLRDFGAQGFLGGLATSVTIRNVGPVLIAFILSGKVGAYTSAELGTMQVTDQMNAIRCLGTDPVEYLIVPRMVAVVLSSFLLLIVGLMMTIGGGLLIAAVHLGVNSLSFIGNIPKLVQWWGVGTGVVKSFVFGVIIAVISCYRGYTTTGGAEGVGRTVKSSAVQTLVIIIVIDVALTSLSAFIYGLLGMGQQ